MFVCLFVCEYVCVSVFQCLLVCEFGSGLGLILRLTLCVGV